VKVGSRLIERRSSGRLVFIFCTQRELRGVFLEDHFSMCGVRFILFFLLCLTFKMSTRCCYTEFEVNLLKELVGKRIDILENKRFDFKTINEKN